MNLVVKAKMPLRWAATLLASLCDQVDHSPEIDQALVQAIEAGVTHLAEAIDRRKALMWAIEGNLKMARGVRAEMDAYVQKLKAIQERVKKTTKEAMLENPDLPWQDTVGQKLTLAKTGGKLKLIFDVKEKREFTNLIDPETIRMFDIPTRYLTSVYVETLNTKAVKAALKAGEALPWAEIEERMSVRGLKPKSEDNDDDE